MKLELRCCDGGAGGANDFPLPKILPPPSFRLDMIEIYQNCEEFYLRISPAQDIDLLKILYP